MSAPMPTLPGSCQPDPYRFRTGLELAHHACDQRRTAALVHYFDVTLTGGEVDSTSDALACALAAAGISRGDRVALYLQNVPGFVIALIAAWKLGAVAVPINPMLRRDELATLLRDSGASALISLDDLYLEVAREVLPGSDVRLAVTVSPLDYLLDVPPLLSGRTRPGAGDAVRLIDLVEHHRGQRPPPVDVQGDDPALLMYTSGTTGPSKAAINLHRNVAWSGTAFADWVSLGSGSAADSTLVMAPLFHITGLITGLAASLAAAVPMVLGFRFDAATVLSLIAGHRPTVTVAAITAYLALLNDPGLAPADLSCLRAAYTGGAPVPAQAAATWQEATGVRLHNAYGLTETTSPAALTPLGAAVKLDPQSGIVSVGMPLADTEISCVADDGAVLPALQIGELVVSGPQVVPGYWRQPAETAHAFPGGRLHTGDIGYLDAEGWVFVIDRSKDVINASGFKVWPGDVERVLYTHPGVWEAAVVGAPDPYRGETVVAYVRLHPQATTTPTDLLAYCRERLAAYRRPRRVVVLPELPKNPAGKILRRALREPQPSAGVDERTEARAGDQGVS